MVLIDETKVEETTQELFIELDKGIEDMEAGRVTPHEEDIKRIYMRVYLLISLRLPICLIFTNTPYKVYNRA